MEVVKHMKIIYSDMEIPKRIGWKSIFLAGPTPRDSETPSWRPGALEILEKINYNGVVFVPEPQIKNSLRNYDLQADWEDEGLNKSLFIIFWIPRELKTMPAFTTNVEFGRFAHLTSVLYGRPDNAPKTRYLDWYYTKYNPRMKQGGKIYNNLEELLNKANI
jgi:hypothetical protein